MDGIFPLPTMPHSRQITMPALQCLHTQDRLTCIPNITVSSTVMPRWVSGPGFLSAAAREGQRQLSCSHDLVVANSPTCHWWQGQKRGKGNLSLDDNPHPTKGKTTSPKLTLVAGSWATSTSRAIFTMVPRSESRPALLLK